MQDEKPIGPEALPKLPWNILWIDGFCYLVAADNRKIATIYGRQEQREAVAWTMMAAFGKKPKRQQDEGGRWL